MLPSEDKSVLDVEVSCFRSGYDTTPVDISLLTILQSTKNKDKVETLRLIRDEKQRREAKKFLPSFTPSGVFAGRPAESLIRHSGFIQFDIDLKDNAHIPNYSNLKEQISNLTCVAYCGLSVSGTGYWGLVPIAYPEKHKEHFYALQNMFRSIGITIDKACKDVSRLRYCSWDEQAYFNHTAKTFYTTATPATPTTFRLPRRKTNLPDNGHRVEQYINEIEAKRVDITEGNENWFSIGCSLANAFGEAGRDYFHRVSQFNRDYTYEETDRLFTRCLKARYQYSIGTFYHLCKQAGISLNQLRVA